MNSRHNRIIGILILLLGLLTSYAASAARPVKVNSAEPAEAPQNTTLEVTINGSGFDTAEDAVTAVNFLLPCDVEPCIETGNVKTLGWVVHNTKKIVATVEIGALAIVEFRDIEVKMTRGRGGKGTTLFKVQAAQPFSEIDITAGYAGAYAWEQSWYFPNWLANTLDPDEVPRPCYVGINVSNPPSGGRYDCSYEDAHGGRLSIDLAGIPGLQWQPSPGKNRKSHPEFCDLLNNWETHFPAQPLQFGVSFYKIRFEGGCYGGSCPVQIATHSFNGDVPQQGTLQLHPFHDLPLGLPDVGRMTLNGFTEAIPTPGDHNAFTQSQSMEIHRFQIGFESFTNSKLIGSCETSGEFSDVFFLTTPGSN